VPVFIFPEHHFSQFIIIYNHNSRIFTYLFPRPRTFTRTGQSCKDINLYFFFHGIVTILSFSGSHVQDLGLWFSSFRGTLHLCLGQKCQMCPFLQMLHLYTQLCTFSAGSPQIGHVLNNSSFRTIVGVFAIA